MKTLNFLQRLLLVKISRVTTLPIAVFIIISCAAMLKPGPGFTPISVDEFFQNKLQTLRKDLTYFKQLGQQKKSQSFLKKAFFKARLSYKKLAILTEYFNPYETFSLNYPAIDRVEEDNPDQIIPPKGFQAAEQLLFGDWSSSSYDKLDPLLADMLKAISRLENETDRAGKFRDEMVWDAIRAATLRLMTLGITGFDSPVAQYSLVEARASLAGMGDLLLLFKNRAGQKSLAQYDALFNLIRKGTDYLVRHNDFNSFDRLAFLQQYMNPLYKQLRETRKSSGISLPEGNNPVNLDAGSIFDTDAFNINFYAPSKEYWMTPTRVELGKKLFFDPILSGNNSRSCASCHKPELAFADGMKTPLAIDNKTPLNRNTPTLWNSALQTRQFLDSRVDILENQLDEVVHNEAEMKGSLKRSVIQLRNDPGYFTLFQQAYSEEKDPLTPFNIANAIASYVRSLVALDSRFDRYMRGDKSKLTASEKNGFNLFAGKAKCATCHFMPVFNGLVPPVFTETESEVIGVPRAKTKNPAELDDDLGKYLFTKSAIHKRSFKTPTLRNIELTGPYMHNGVFTTLEEVMDFYNLGGGKGLHIDPPNQTLPFDKLNLSKNEIGDIIAFMKALTDTVYITKSH